MENVVDDKEFRKECLYYKFPSCGDELFSDQLERNFYILYRPDKERKQYLNENESVGLYNNKAMIQDNGGKYKYIMNGGKLLSSDTLKKITDPTINTIINIFHHNDLDGDASASIVNLFVSNPYFNNTVWYTSYGYTIDSITPACENSRNKRMSGRYAIGVIVDISLTEEYLRELLTSFDEIIWIDHHTTSISQLRDKQFNLGKSQIILDTRYSAAYLCYNLFKGYIKKYCNLSINDTLPTLVSIEDTKPDNKQDTYLPVTLTEALRKRIKAKSIPFKISIKTDLINPSDYYYESTLNGSKTIYIKNAIDYEKNNFKFNKCRFYGMYLNAYYRNMGGMNCYDTIYETLFSNDRELFKILEIGKGFKELDISKKKLMSESEAMYTATYNGKTIIGNANNHISTQDETNLVTLLIRRVNSTKIKVTAMSISKTVRNIGIDRLFKELFTDLNPGGHKGISSVTISVKDVNSFFNDLVSGGSYKYNNFNELKRIYSDMEIKVSGSELRKDETIKRTFIMFSIGLFNLLYSKTQKNVERMINA